MYIPSKQELYTFRKVLHYYRMADLEHLIDYLIDDTYCLDADDVEFLRNLPEEYKEQMLMEFEDYYDWTRSEFDMWTGIVNGWLDDARKEREHGRE